MNNNKAKLSCHCDAGISDEDRCLNCDQKLIYTVPWGYWFDWLLAIVGSVIALLMVYWRIRGWPI